MPPLALLSTAQPSAASAADDPLTPVLQALCARINQRLAELLPQPANASDQVAIAMRDGVLAPGKRIRPLLMLLIGKGLAPQPPGALLDLACAVEMVHAASLMLDDMPCMDNARLRRGRMAVHARYGQDIAMLAAVALLSHACGMVAATDGLDGAARARLVVVLCDAVGLNGLVRGQYRDLHEGAAARPASEIASANAQKTGALFAAAFEMAAIACAANAATRQALRTAATDLGHAFQLRDDLEDGASAAVTITKDRHKDEGKSTMVALLGRAAVQDLLSTHLDLAQAQLRLALPLDDAALQLLRRSFVPAARPLAQAPRQLKLQVLQG